MNCPEVTTFAIPDPEIVPINADEATQTCAGPPRVCPKRPNATSLKSLIIPARSKNEPNKINKKTNVQET